MAHPTKQRGKTTSKEASQSLGMHAELAAFFCFGNSDAEEAGSREPFPIE
jgi:hypothetical protein